MLKNTSNQLGTESIKRLLIRQSVPAAVGMLVLSLNMIGDTIFVGQWIGSMAIAAVTVVSPLIFLISSIGMSIGIAGASMISRALGAGNKDRANKIFGNMLSLTLLPTTILCLACSFFEKVILQIFGANQIIYQVASPYYQTLLWGVPLLAVIMLGNNIARAEAKPKMAMNALLVSAISNTLLNFVVLNYFDYGLLGVGVVTVLSYIFSLLFLLRAFWNKTELTLTFSYCWFDKTIVKQILTLGSVSFFRQGSSNLLSIVLNHSLLLYGGVSYVAVYGIISRVSLLIFFPILGIIQGMMPIVGYNYGSKQYDRVIKVVNMSVYYTAVISIILFAFLMLFPTAVTYVFTKDKHVLSQTPFAMRMVFLAVPIIIYNLISSSYFQAIGHSTKAMILTLSRQLFFLVPLIIVLPLYLDLWGIWLAFPISDVLSSALAFIFLKKSLNHLSSGLLKS